MEPIASIDFQSIGIATLIQRESLKVLRHQREYSWEAEHVDDLFQDIGDAIADNSSIYFLGTVVLTSSKRGGLRVVDGQQRLATTSILVAAMRDFMSSINDDEMANSIEQDFLRPFDRTIREKTPKLTLNVDDNEYFKQRILSRADSTERENVKSPILQSHRLLDDAANKAVAYVKTIVQGHRDPVKRINYWLEYLKTTR